jgi:formylmethanofuran dehydrogenase subunit E
LLDGIQLSSHCTLGKGNIKVREARSIKAKFRKGKRTIAISLTGEVKKILGTLTEDTPQSALSHLALSFFRMPEQQLFLVTE